MLAGDALFAGRGGVLAAFKRDSRIPRACPASARPFVCAQALVRRTANPAERCNDPAGLDEKVDGMLERFADCK
jgi:hypothetical protein